MRAIDPRIKVRTLPGLTPAGVHPELNDVDLIIGCVDHDGPRHRLNQIAIDTRTPLLDNPTGVTNAAPLSRLAAASRSYCPARPA